MFGPLEKDVMFVLAVPPYRHTLSSHPSTLLIKSLINNLSQACSGLWKRT